MHTEGIDFADLESFDDGYLRELRDHLSSGRAGSARGGEEEEVNVVDVGRDRSIKPVERVDGLPGGTERAKRSVQLH